MCMLSLYVCVCVCMFPFECVLMCSFSRLFIFEFSCVFLYVHLLLFVFFVCSSACVVMDLRCALACVHSCGLVLMFGFPCARSRCGCLLMCLCWFLCVYVSSLIVWVFLCVCVWCAQERAINHAAGSHGISGIFMKYDISSLMVKVSEQHMPLWKFLVRLCGIVGGIFSTTGTHAACSLAGMHGTGRLFCVATLPCRWYDGVFLWWSQSMIMFVNEMPVSSGGKMWVSTAPFTNIFRTFFEIMYVISHLNWLHFKPQSETSAFAVRIVIGRSICASRTSSCTTNGLSVWCRRGESILFVPLRVVYGRQ